MQKYGKKMNFLLIVIEKIQYAKIIKLLCINAPQIHG